MGDQIWQGGPVLSAKIGRGTVFWWQTDFFIRPLQLDY